MELFTKEKSCKPKFRENQLSDSRRVLYFS